MKTAQSEQLNLDTVGWGILFIWWGITELFSFLPDGTGAIGVGLILLGLNAARSLRGVPISEFSTIIGILALVWGVLDLAGALLSLPFELPVFAILLITLGVILLGREIMRSKTKDMR